MPIKFIAFLENFQALRALMASDIVFKVENDDLIRRAWTWRTTDKSLFRWRDIVDHGDVVLICVTLCMSFQRLITGKYLSAIRIVAFDFNILMNTLMPFQIVRPLEAFPADCTLVNRFLRMGYLVPEKVVICGKLFFAFITS